MSTYIHSRRLKHRRGATTVEFALTLPILFLLVLASIEFSRANVLINTTKLAAAEGARKGIILGTTADDIRQVVQHELAMVGVKESEVVVEPAVVTDDTELVTVGVSVPLAGENGYVTPRYFLGEYVVKITTIPRESKNDEGMDSKLAAAFNDMKGKLDKSKGKGKGK